jgi:hypothetical protein
MSESDTSGSPPCTAQVSECVAMWSVSRPRAEYGRGGPTPPDRFVRRGDVRVTPGATRPLSKLAFVCLACERTTGPHHARKNATSGGRNFATPESNCKTAGSP